MINQDNPSEVSTSTTKEATVYTYEQVVNALLEASVCCFPKPTNEDKFSNRQEHLQLLKTIQILTMKRKQFDEEEISKRAKVIEPLTVLTKGNKALLDEAEVKKKFLNKEIEKSRQKLEALKKKKADQILQHEQELQAIKDKINDLNHSQKTLIHCSHSQSNILLDTNKTKDEIALKKKRKSDVIRNKSKTLLDEIVEDKEAMQESIKENQDKPKSIQEVKPRNVKQNTMKKPQAKSARSSLSLGNTDNQIKHRKSLGETAKSLQTRSSTSENYEAVQKRMLALFQAKRKSRNSLTSSQIQNISLNDDDKKDKNKSSMSLNEETPQLSQTLVPSTSHSKLSIDSDNNATPKQNTDNAEPQKNIENENRNAVKNKNPDQHKQTRSRIPKRPRINYTQC